VEINSALFFSESQTVIIQIENPPQKTTLLHL